MNKKVLLLASIVAGGYYITKRNPKARLDQYNGSGQTVLITGASGGIGQEMAFVFARHHFNVVAVARNEAKLNALKDELENSYDVEVTTIVKDLSNESAAKEIYDEVKEKGIVIDQLVNNAGAGKQSTVADANPETMLSLIHLNVSAVTLLSHYFVKDMVERGSGRILNVSSMGAFIPDPYFNVYGPTKAYEMYLTQGMYGELKDTGVTVTALCPGPTKTNWATNAGKADSKMAKSAEQVAQEGFRGMQKGDLIVIPNADYRVFKELSKFMPAKLLSNVIGNWQKKLINK